MLCKTCNFIIYLILYFILKNWVVCNILISYSSHIYIIYLGKFLKGLEWNRSDLKAGFTENNFVTLDKLYLFPKLQLYSSIK